MRISFGFPTCRADCGFDWFVAALITQARRVDFDLRNAEIVAVDQMLHSSLADDRRAEFQDIVAGRITLVHVPPKPNPWNGPARLTVDEYAAHASARNTLFCHSSGDHLISVDDLSVPDAGWLAAHLEGAQAKRLTAGVYPKRSRVVVDPDGALVSSEPWSGDGRSAPFEDETRIAYGSRTGPAGWFFTGNVGVPMTIALEVNGFDEVLDAIGLEDCDFGVRADRAGHPVWIEPRARTIQAQDRRSAQEHVSVSYKRAVPWTKDLESYLSRDVWTTGNAFALKELRAHILTGGSYPAPVWFPSNHWIHQTSIPLRT